MKFINYLEKIMGVDVYALSSFLIFFLFFIGVALWVWKADKKTMQQISHIPLEDDSNYY
ncbi:CcoQ/FixQ family Cbb3-type cytochrome c oxidase assembly chaperone [Hydrotalea sp.]|uniref:CcoQ/FixQ family Cbb3-type cytochrome c oxidase assembly chaperone n=1 Tax=Hydrotalea sp. TaxID=2881279 RepID=UPI00262B1DA7|nr:CcoQ/FixQ family Cbb3-type cytochrome c oxidase assembly chaperone [Hydrotalea sp.]